LPVPIVRFSRADEPNAVAVPPVDLLKALFPNAVEPLPVVFSANAPKPIAVLDEIFPPPFPTVNPLTVISVKKFAVFEKVFAPANVCVPVVTTPPFVASAGVNINSVVPLITAPLAFEVPEIAPIVLKPALAAVMEALTYSVVATFVELSLVAGVGAVGVPVNAGETSGAFKAKLVLIVAMSVEFAVILVVFAATFVFNVAMLFVFAVMLAVFAFTLFVNVNSAALAVVASVVMAVAFVAIEAVLVAIAVAFAVMLVVLAATFVFSVAMLFVFAVMLAVFAAIAFVFAVINPGKVAIVLELTPPTELTVVAKDPFPEPLTSPVNAVVAFAAITSVPITKPKFVLAPAAVDAPVPPFKTARLPLIFAEVILLSATPAFALC
jgi:hypothetical protein